MKKVAQLLTLTLLCLFLFSCTTNPVVQEGKYVMKEKVDPPSPSIEFSKDNGFTFTYDYLSSYRAIGSYEIKDNKVISTTSDGLFTYVFEIKDKDTLLFKEEGSSSIRMTEGKTPISDGTEFIFTPAE